MNPFDLVLSLSGIPVVVASGYLGLLAACAWRPRVPTYGPPRLKFDLIVPAHDEELGIAATVKNLLSIDYPPALRRVVVVADNCQDATAEKARAAGAEVLERKDLERRGKGYALELAFEHSGAAGFADALVVVDADTFVSNNLLLAFSAAIERGARAAQANYGVLNPAASWRTRLMTIALAMFNDLRSLGRERLGWSAGLRGNGMCFTRELLAEVPHRAYSLVEDLEYGLRVGLAGNRVHYAADASVKGEMVSSERASRSQRRRWEGGRAGMARLHAGPLLREAARRRSGMLLDLAIDLLVPPLSYLALGLVLGTGLALTLSLTMGSFHLVSVALFGTCDALFLGYVLQGWRLSGVGPRGLLDLMWAPVFIAWKLTLLLSRSDRRSKAEWVRTAREGESHPHES